MPRQTCIIRSSAKASAKLAAKASRYVSDGDARRMMTVDIHQAQAELDKRRARAKQSADALKLRDRIIQK